MQNIMQRFSFLLFFCVVIPGTIVAQNQLNPKVETAIRQMNMIPFKDEVEAVNFQLSGLDGKTYSLESYPDTLIMLNFWASWCGPCRVEMPSMQALYNDFYPKGLEIIAVNQRESRDIAASFMNQYNYTFPALLDHQGTVGFQYGVRSIPLTYIITPEGRIIAGKPGAQDWNTPGIREALEILINFYLQ